MMEGTTFGKQIPFGFTTSNIYVIRNSDLGLYKIGYSDDVQRRLKALQVFLLPYARRTGFVGGSRLCR